MCSERNLRGKWHFSRKLVIALAHTPTMKQRIEALYDDGKISREQFYELMHRERYVRGALTALKPKLGESFDDFLSRSYDHAECKGRQHRWDEVDVMLDYRPIGAAFYETERCERCGMIKVIIVNGLGQKDRNDYKPPEGYSFKGVKTSKSDWKVLLRYKKLDQQLAMLEQGLTQAEPDNVVHLDRGRTA